MHITPDIYVHIIYAKYIYAGVCVCVYTYAYYLRMDIIYMHMHTCTYAYIIHSTISKIRTCCRIRTPSSALKSETTSCFVCANSGSRMLPCTYATCLLR